MNRCPSRALLLTALLLSACVPDESDDRAEPTGPAPQAPPPEGGSLDASFGSAGIALVAVGTSYDMASGVAIQSDGKIVVAGTTVIDGKRDFAVARFTADGTLDAGFGGDGIVVADAGTNYDDAKCVIIQPDGKIIVAGSDNDNFAMIRYRSDGTLDDDFDGDGKVNAAIGGALSASGIALQADGKILLTGYTWIGSRYYFGTVRYTPDGAVDASFGSAGIAVTDIAGFSDVSNDIAVQPDGRIVVAGGSNSGSSYEFAVVRYEADGTLDAGFDGDGKAVTSFGSGDDLAEALAIQADGRIVIAGYAPNGNDVDFAVARYTIDGSLDTTFAGSGKVVTPVGIVDDLARAVAIQADGKIIVGGGANGAGFAMVRYTPDGSLDSGFGGDGKVTVAVGSGFGSGTALAIHPDGRIVMAGEGNGASIDFAVARFLP